jgi:hypothetical protein
MKKAILIFAIFLAFGVAGFVGAQTTCTPMVDDHGRIIAIQGSEYEECAGFGDQSVGVTTYNCDENGDKCDGHFFVCDGLCTDTGGNNNDSCRKRTQGNPNKTGELSCGGSCSSGYQCAPNWPVKKDPKAGWCYCKKKNVSSSPATSPGSSAELLASSEPTPTPTAPEITSFEITNFKLQQSSGGSEYYQCLKEQMAVEHPNYQLNLAWDVFGAETCTASGRVTNAL